MPDTLINSTTASDLSSAMTDYTVDSKSTEGAGDSQETRWQNSEWSMQYGYYSSIPELKTAIKTKATWTVGAGFEADESTKLILLNVKGNGKDTFSSILHNLIRVKTIGGDSYAEIITDDNGFLLNLKPLDPGSMVIVQDKKGMVKRYEQTSRTKKYNSRFPPEKILHLCRDRLADEIHGESVITAVQWIIDARNEAMTDWKRVLHRNIDPLFIYHLDTDDTSEIASFKTKNDAARGKGENMYIPKGVVVPELVATAQNASLNPLTWINQLNDYFFQAVNTPQIIIGNAKEFTDASGKIVYLSYEQSVKADQLYIEEQLLSQLNLDISLIFPASLQNELISDKEKDPNQLQANEPNDQQVEMEGKT